MDEDHKKSGFKHENKPQRVEENAKNQFIKANHVYMVKKVADIDEPTNLNKKYKCNMRSTPLSPKESKFVKP